MINARSSSSPALRWFLMAESRLLINSCVSCELSSLIMTYVQDISGTKGGEVRHTHQVHGLRDETARHANVDGSLLTITRKYPDLRRSQLSSGDHLRT